LSLKALFNLFKYEILRLEERKSQLVFYHVIYLHRSPLILTIPTVLHEEHEQIQSLLDKKLGKDQIAIRMAPSGLQLYYLETNRAIELANEVFGYNGWSSSVITISPDYMEESGGKFGCGVTAVVRVQLKDGSFHEDIGYGCCNNMRMKGTAFETAKKEAVSDATKRALRLFGKYLGNCLYDKDHLKTLMKTGQSLPPTLNTAFPQVYNTQVSGTHQPLFSNFSQQSSASNITGSQDN